MRSGFVSIIGRPNVGKSTLLNALIGQKVSIITPKPQTTRQNIQGIYHGEDVQIVFVDTPGIHKPIKKIGETMNKAAFSSLKEIEAALLVVDVSQMYSFRDEFLITRLKEVKNLIVCFNKIDLTNVQLIEKLKAIYKEKFPQSRQIEISAIKKTFVGDVIKAIQELLPEGPPYYPKDIVYNYPESFLFSEIIREKIMLLTKEEIPHVIAVTIDKIDQSVKDKTIVHASIIVEKDSQKPIIIGKNGATIKQIGILARQEIEQIQQTHYDLQLFVRVEKEWRDSILRLKEFGLISE